MSRVAVVIPCYRVASSILDVLGSIGPECNLIFVIDDACPEKSGQRVESEARDPRIKVLYHTQNQGVGGAVMTGYRAALDAGADIVVKLDGDGQMDPRLLPRFISPLIRGDADYAKGNRFYSIYNIRTMPLGRLIGNAILSFMTKLSSGYWSLFDPTNGYTAVHSAALTQLEFNNISRRYFFESDMLINLGSIRAVVIDVPMEARYGNERSNLNAKKVIIEFFYKHTREFFKRILYVYFLRDFNIGSVHLIGSTILMVFGIIFGAFRWEESIVTGMPATTGTVILATLPILLGFQLVLNFVTYDVSNEPTVPLQRLWNSPPPAPQHRI